MLKLLLFFKITEEIKQNSSNGRSIRLIKNQIVGARMVGGSVTKTTELLGVERGTVPKVMISFEKEEKNFTLK